MDRTRQTTRWLLTGLAGVLLVPMTGAWAQGTIQITGTKKTASKWEGKRQDLPRGDTQLKEEQVYYRFDIKSIMPVSGPLEARWVVLLERANGRLHLAESGRKSVVLKMGQTVSLDTDAIKLIEREFGGPKGGGEWTDRIAGYGVRLINAEGQIIAEKISSPSLKDDVERAFAAERQPKVDDPRERRRLNRFFRKKR